MKELIRKLYYRLFILKLAGRLKRFKNCHEGQRCFVIGNGPSLTTDDLDKLKNEYTFACNKIYRLFDKTTWRPTYYVLQDRAVMFDDYDMLVPTSKECTACFLNGIRYWEHPKELRKADNVFFFYIHTVTDENGEPPVFADITKGTNNGSTITFGMLQFAIYMGFKEIYLLGVDNNFSHMVDRDGNVIVQDIKDHFEGGDHASLKNINIEAWKLEQTYLSAKKYADAHGIKICNATRGGKLEVFERVNLDQVLGVGK